MGIPEDVVAFLRNHPGVSFCDDCIQSQLKLKRRQQAQRVTDAIKLTSDFVREKASCSECKTDKLVTKAVVKQLLSADAFCRVL